jgi:hypothetical protein
VAPISSCHDAFVLELDVFRSALIARGGGGGVAVVGSSEKSISTGPNSQIVSSRQTKLLRCAHHVSPSICWLTKDIAVLGRSDIIYPSVQITATGDFSRRQLFDSVCVSQFASQRLMAHRFCLFVEAIHATVTYGVSTYRTQRSALLSMNVCKAVPGHQQGYVLGILIVNGRPVTDKEIHEPRLPAWTSQSHCTTY